MPLEDHEPIRILIAEDEPTLRRTCEGVLRAQGHHVDATSNGAEALDHIRDHVYDVILVDLYIEGGPGIKILRAALARNPDVLVIAMTGNPSLESTLEVLELGGWDYLPKPFSAKQIEILIGRAQHAVQERRAAGARPRVRLPASLARSSYGAAREAVLREFDIRYLQQALERADGDRDQVARVSGLTRDEVDRLVERYGLGAEPRLPAQNE